MPKGRPSKALKIGSTLKRAGVVQSMANLCNYAKDDHSSEPTKNQVKSPKVMSCFQKKDGRVQESCTTLIRVGCCDEKIIRTFDALKGRILSC